MRISDWSSDVCSSDLTTSQAPAATMAAQAAGGCRAAAVPASPSGRPRPREGWQPRLAGRITGQHVHAYPPRRQCRQGGIVRGDERAEGRSVGKEGVSPCISWVLPYHYNNKK